MRAPLSTSARLLHLLSLATLSSSQPILDQLGRHAQFLVAHRIEGGSLVLLVGVLLLAIPIMLFAIEQALGFVSERAQSGFHLTCIAGLTALLALQIFTRLPAIGPWPTLLLALLIGIVMSRIYARNQAARTLVSLSGVIVILAPIVFLTQPTVAPLLRAAQTDVQDYGQAFGYPPASVPAQHGDAHTTASSLPTLDTDAPIILVILDELGLPTLLDREGAINRHRFPNFAYLADRASWFRRTAAIAAETQLAVPSILTGREPKPKALMTADSHPESLFSLFANSHELWSFEPASSLCPPALDREEHNRELGGWAALAGRWGRLLTDLSLLSLHQVAPPAWAERLPPVDQAWAGFLHTEAPEGPSAPTAARFFFRKAVRATLVDRREDLERFLDAVDQSHGPTLHMLHLMLPHRPWDLLPTGHRYPIPARTPGTTRNRWNDDPYLLRQAAQRLTLQLRYVDTFLGRLFTILERTERFDSALIVVTADHGSALHPEVNPRDLSPATTPEVVPVPLFIKAPGQKEGRIVDRAVSSVDILPMMLQALEVSAPWHFDGKAMLHAGEHTLLPFYDRDDQRHDLTTEIFAGTQTIVSRNLSWLGEGADPLDLYRQGQDGDLIGQQVDTFARPGPSHWQVSLEHPERLENVSRAGPTLPVLMTGHFRSPQGETALGSLAVALNGTVAAVVPIEQVPPRAWIPITALLPPDLLTDGPNEVEIFEIRRRKRVRLRRVTLVTG